MYSLQLVLLDTGNEARFAGSYTFAGSSSTPRSG